ncbi:cytochrome P450 4F6-like [Gigantopelta aegis]|uniref:cytochrome P450 4F6-like n=1 Tax=Gigantopelta aegis TaxID=1735272 RepID=UPI001B889AC8|nr:cytochrome P450 4F6-like [Gigantopelta aegis]
MDTTVKAYIPTILKTVGICMLTLGVVKAIQIVRFVRKRWDMFKECPIVGDFRFISGTLHMYSGPDHKTFKTMQYIAKNFRRYHMDWMGPILPSFILSHPDVAKLLLKTSEPKARNLGLGMSASYEMGVPWLGEGLLIANGERWARNRRLLTPAFHFDILNPYVTVYNKAADVLLERGGGRMEASSSRDEPFELFENITLTSLDILLQCAFSYNSNCQIIGDKHPYVTAVQELTDLWVNRSLRPWLYLDFVYKLTPDGRRFQRHCNYVHKVAEDIIRARKHALESKPANSPKSDDKHKYLDFLDILLTAKDENGVGMTDLEIRNEVDTFLFEGHDTTTSAICWILYSLAEHPDIQERVYHEVAQLMANKEGEFLAWDDLQHMKYLHLCIKEGLRQHTPVPFVQRKTTQEMVLDGCKIPPGSLVAVQIYELHHNPDVWEEPNEFRPERFLPENMIDMDPYAFVAFSAGPRNCIGQNFALREIKTVIARIIYRYQMTLDPSHEVRPKLSLVMKAETGIKILVKPRT